MTGPKARRIISETDRYRVKCAYSYPLVIADGKGCYIIDADGKKYLDFNSIVCTNNVGYGRPEIQKIVREYSRKGTYKVDGTNFYNEEALALAKKLIGICPKNLKKAFFVNSGSEAVENAIKFAYRKKGPYVGISFDRAFHGRTLGALSFTESKTMQKKNYPQVPNHFLKFCTSDDDTDIGELEDYLKREALPAFVIIEPVQGEGGYRPASKKFIETIYRLCKENRIAFILDEIQSGMGRTGKWWAHEHYNVKPDIMTAAKSLQVGATITSREYEITEPGAVGSTWGGGHRLDLAVGLEVINIIERDNLLKNAARMGEYILKRVKELKERYPVITGVNGLGLMIGIDFSTASAHKHIMQSAFEKGLLLLTCGDKSIRISPPLIVTEREADKGLSIIEDCLRKLK